MYETAFDVEWASLSREDAMFRAYALGVDAALGNDHPREVERLARETSRPLVQLAYDEGKSVAEEELRTGDEVAGPEAYEGTDGGWWLWKELVERRRENPESLELVRVPTSRTDRPDALSRPAFLDPHDRDVDAIRLPRFLLE
ncbi:MAG: hypothetical protein ACQEQY_11150 [Halobacteriota archaeon]